MNKTMEQNEKKGGGKEEKNGSTPYWSIQLLKLIRKIKTID